MNKIDLQAPHKNKKFWEELIAYFPSYNKGHNENDASNNSIVARIFVTAVSLPSNNKGIFTEPLPSNDRGHTQTHPHTDSNVIL
jgi:hypothetical protein